MKNAIVPRATRTMFNSGKHCVTSKPGDLILVVHNGFLPFVIRFGQRIRYWVRRNVFRQAQYKKEFCAFNHSMIVIIGGKEAKVSQMEAKGGTIVDLQNYKSKRYVVVSPIEATNEQLNTVVQFGLWCEGIKYGWFSIFGMILDCFIPTIELALGSGQRMVCSTASSLAHRCIGLVPDQADTSVFPADLARYYDVTL